MNNQLLDSRNIIFKLLHDLPGNLTLQIKLDGKEFINFNPDFRHPAVGLSKLLILEYFFEEIDHGRLNLDQTIGTAPQSIVNGKGVLSHLSMSNWKISDLITLILTIEDDSAANLLISSVGPGTINQWLQNSKYQNTSFERFFKEENNIDRTHDNLITGQDASNLMSDLLDSHNTSRSFINYSLRAQQNKSKISGYFEYSQLPIVIMNYTGEGLQIDHDVARYIFNHHQVDLTFLSSESSDRIAIYNGMQLIGEQIFHILRAL